MSIVLSIYLLQLETQYLKCPRKFALIFCRNEDPTATLATVDTSIRYNKSHDSSFYVHERDDY